MNVLQNNADANQILLLKLDCILRRQRVNSIFLASIITIDPPISRGKEIVAVIIVCNIRENMRIRIPDIIIDKPATTYFCINEIK